MPERDFADEVRKESVVERELSSLSKATGELVRQAEMLEARLQTVLRAQPKTAEGSAGVPTEELTAVPSEIRRSRFTVDGANYTLKSILSRLEI